MLNFKAPKINFSMNTFHHKIEGTFINFTTIGSLLMHITEAALTAMCYTQVQITDKTDSFMVMFIYLYSVTGFLIVAGVSFGCAFYLPKTFANIGRSMKNGKGVIEAILLSMVILIVYLFIQHIFIMANVVFGGLADTKSMLIKWLPSTITLSDSFLKTVKDNVATIVQAKEVVIAIFLVYANIGLEILIAAHVLYLDKIDDAKK